MYPLVNKQFANLKTAIDMVDLSINSMVISHRELLVYQREMKYNSTIAIRPLLDYYWTFWYYCNFLDV